VDFQFRTAEDIGEDLVDTGFIALGYATYDLDRALTELESLFEGQWKNGMLPHIIFRPETEENAEYFPGPDFWQTAAAGDSPDEISTSGIGQPPVHGFVLWRLWQQAEADSPARARLKALYPKVLALHHYYYTHRNPDGDGLVIIRHPWESGTDNAPAWDVALARFDTSKVSLPSYVRKDLIHGKAAHRPTQHDYDYYVYLIEGFRQAQYDEAHMAAHCPFQMQDPLHNAILMHSNEGLMQLAQAIGEPTGALPTWQDQTREALNRLLWNEETGMYHVRDRLSGQLLPHQIASGFMPLLAGVPTEAQAGQMVHTLMEAGFMDMAHTELALLPTYSRLAQDFHPEKYWRGPVWINMSWLLYHGLQRYVYGALANQVKEAALTLLREAGVYEYFHPGTEAIRAGQPLGTGQFSWSAALLLDWLSET